MRCVCAAAARAALAIDVAHRDLLASTMTDFICLCWSRAIDAAVDRGERRRERRRAAMGVNYSHASLDVVVASNSRGNTAGTRR